MRLSSFAASIFSLGLALAGAAGCEKAAETETPSANGGSGSGGSGSGGSGSGGSGSGGSGSGGSGSGGSSSGGSGGSSADTGGGGVTFVQVQALFNKSCIFCHTGGGATLPSAMNIKIYADLMADSKQCTGDKAKKRIQPGDASKSYIINKLRGTDLCSGGKMPMGLSALSETDIMLVEAWINGGAPM